MSKAFFNMDNNRFLFLIKSYSGVTGQGPPGCQARHSCLVTLLK